MSAPVDFHVTRLLAIAGEEYGSATHELLRAVYHELRQLARA
jgi:hypothetical protein